MPQGTWRRKKTTFAYTENPKLTWNVAPTSFMNLWIFMILTSITPHILYFRNHNPCPHHHIANLNGAWKLPKYPLSSLSSRSWPLVSCIDRGRCNHHRILSRLCVNVKAADMSTDDDGRHGIPHWQVRFLVVRVASLGRIARGICISYRMNIFLLGRLTFLNNWWMVIVINIFWWFSISILLINQVTLLDLLRQRFESTINSNWFKLYTFFSKNRPIDFCDKVFLRTSNFPIILHRLRRRFQTLRKIETN